MSNIHKTALLVRTGFLGVLVSPVTTELTEQFDLPTDTEGLVILQVLPDTPAHEFGLMRGYVIQAIDGTEVVFVDQLRQELSLAGPGATVTLTIFDGETTSSIDVTLEENFLDLDSLLPE